MPQTIKAKHYKTQKRIQEMNEFFIDQDEANIEANGNKANSEVIKLEKTYLQLLFYVIFIVFQSIKKNTNIETTDIVKQTSKQMIKK